MNYQWHYDQLMITRKDRIAEEGKYYERHHIVPRCIGGENTKENIVKLTAREHFIAHWLLWRIYGTFSMAAAFRSMCNFRNEGQKHTHISSRAFSEAREAQSKKMSEFMKGRRHSLGYTHNIETCEKMASAKRNMTEENRENIGKAQLGQKRSTTTIAKMKAKRAEKIYPYEFYFQNELIDTLYSQKDAIQFCRDQKIPFTPLVYPDSGTWREWKVIKLFILKHNRNKTK